MLVYSFSDKVIKRNEPVKVKRIQTYLLLVVDYWETGMLKHY